MQIAGAFVIYNPPQIGIGNRCGFSGFSFALVAKPFLALVELRLPQLVFAADLVDGLAVAQFSDGCIGHAKPTGKMRRHIGIARAERVRDGIRNGGPRVATFHDPVNLAGDLAGPGLVGDPLSVGLGPVDHVARAREQFGMRIEVAALLFFDTPLRAGDDLPLPRLDLVFGQAFRTHVLADRALHVLSGVPMIMDPLHDGAIFHDTVLTQDPCPLQRAALEVETVPLGHPRQIVRDPLALKCRVLRAGLHPRDDNGRTDPGPAQRGVDLRPHLGVSQPVEPGRIDIGLGIDPALRGLFGQCHGSEP